MHLNDHDLRVWAEISLDNLAANLAEVRRKIGPTPEIMASVKADAYGHGAVEIVNTLLYNGVRQLGVAICDEGVTLRKNNIHVPILIFGYTPASQLTEVVMHNLTQTIFNFEMAELLSGIACKMSASPTPIHIKVDTGMSRLGFLPGREALADIQKIASLPGISIAGIYTHFANSDVDDQHFTYEQYARFREFTDALAAAGVHVPLSHMSNSGAIVGCDDLAQDMVRSGILLYGLKPSAGMNLRGMCLRPVMSLKSRISYIRRLPVGVSVGYSRTYYTSRETLVATMPVGYADGYPRVMGNRGSVLVNGRFAPIIGNICMDQFMIDVTDCGAVSAGQQAVLIGKQGALEIGADELASVANTISYEIVCSIGKRVPRLYIKNDEIIKTVNF